MASTTPNNDDSKATTTNDDDTRASTTTNDDDTDGNEPEAALLRFQVELTESSDPNAIPARLIRAGRTQATMGRPDGVLIPESVLFAAAPLFSAVSVFLNHDYRATHEPRNIRDFAGTVINPTYDPHQQAITGIIQPATTTAGQELMALAKTLRHHRLNNLPLPDVGLSADAWWQIQDDQAIALNRVNSVDVVHSPAADGRLFFQQGDPQTMTAETLTPTAPPPAQTPEAAAWLAILSTQVTTTVLANSGLPQASRTRLAAATYTSPEALTQAIEAERTYLGALNQDNVIQVGGRAPRGTVTSGQMTTGQDHMENAVNFLFGVPGHTLPEPVLRNPQMLYFAITGDYEWHGVFRPERVQFATANTTTLAGLAVNAMNKIINSQMVRLAQYRWFEKISAVTPNDGSVQPLQLISYGGIGELPTVAEGAAYTEMDVDDVKETATFYKKGGYVAITQEMFRNSEVQKFRLIPTSLANAAIKTRSKAVSNIFTQASGTGPTLAQDSTVLFHSNHANIATTAFDATAWRAAVVECYKHAEVNSADRIGLMPKYGLFPVDLYNAALIAFGYGDGQPTTYTPEAQSRNEDDPRPVPLAIPHWTDTNNWAYIVDPMLQPVIHISYAQDQGGMSHPAPELFVQAGGETNGLMFSNDALPIKVRDWFAVGVNGYRGVGKRNVA